MSIQQRTFSAVRWTTVAAVVKALLQVAQVAVLARLLNPEDYGLLAMVIVVLSFAGLFSDFGVNSAFVQRRDVTEEQRSSLFWFNVVVSAGLTAVVIALSPVIAAFFGDRRLIPLVALSAITLVVGALGVQVRLAAEKALRFRPVMVLEVSAALTGFVVAVSAALGGWGVYALVAGTVSNAVAFTTLAWLFMAQGWRPAWRLRFADVRSFLGFGGALVANNLANQINLTVDLFLGGRLLPAALLGLYSVPRNLTLQVQFTVNPIITRVAFPLIAEVQHDITRVRSIYLQTMNMTSSTNAPVYVGIAFFAQDITQVLLGDGWGRSGAILRILALWGALRSTGNPVGSLLLGMGRADLSLKWNLVMLLIVPPAVWFGSTHGPEGVVWALFAVATTLFVPGWFALVRPLSHAGLGEYSLAALGPFAIAVLAIAPAYFLADLAHGALLRLMLGVVIALPSYLGLSYLANRRWVDSMLELLGRRKGGG